MLPTFYSSLSKITALQILSIFISSMIVVFNFSFNTGVSFFLGGLINVIPAYLFGIIFLKKMGARASKKIVNNFYISEGVKLLATAVLFILAFQWRTVHAFALFIGFVFAQFIYWILLFRTNKNQLTK